MASAVPNAWAWFRARVGHGAGAESARSPHDVADRRRRREAPLASVSLGGAPDLVAELASVRPSLGRALPLVRPLVSSSRSLTRPPSSPTQTSVPAAVTREELGRATWLFLHTLAAQFPDDPTRQQEKDARDLIHILTRAYPCEVCAAHFAEIVKRDPPDTSSGMALQQWACAAHNEVNASLGKPAFDCAAVASRWAGLDCGGDDEDGCSLENRRAKAEGRGGGGGASEGGGRARIDTY
jgi:FAD-linked sulfhydryl oxidase